MNARLREKLYKAFHEKNAIQRFVARRFLFNLFQRVGLHVTGDHFHEAVPNTRYVAEHYSDSARSLKGIDWRFGEAEQHALRLVRTYGQEYSEACGKYGFREDNPYFKGLDALMLYLVLRDLRPERVIEIGQGFSTRVALAALERNAEETGRDVEFISIDPYRRIPQWTEPPKVRFRAVQKEMQEVELEPLLEGCGFLFIDSSHVYKFGSDVAYEFTQLYPRLPSGMVFHVHDIFSPYDYPKHFMVEEKFFYNEQYFLECFLMFNPAFEVQLPVHLLARESCALKEAVGRLPLDKKFAHEGGSFYLLRK